MREARMAPVQSATRAFETIVAQRKDPALLTWHGAGMYHLRVFPLLPGKQHRVIVAYDVDLAVLSDNPTFSDCGRPLCTTCRFRGYQKWRIPPALARLAFVEAPRFLRRRSGAADN